MTKVILFNGPPRCGKDTAAQIVNRYLCEVFMFPNKISIAEVLKSSVHALFGLEATPDGYEDKKDEKLDAFHGWTPRQAYIDLSEYYIKQRFGNDFFAKSAIRRMRSREAVKPVDHEMVHIITDCGFQEEVDLITEEFGKDNVCLIQIHKDGCDFTIDSRRYVFHRNWVELINRGTLVEYGNEVIKMTREILVHWHKIGRLDKRISDVLKLG